MLLVSDLDSLKIHALTLSTNWKTPSVYLRFKLINSIVKTHSLINRFCHVNFTRNLNEYIKTDFSEISVSLYAITSSTCQLSGRPVLYVVASKLNLGWKYCPFYKPVINKEMRSFCREDWSLFQGYFFKQHFFRLNLDSKNLLHILNASILSFGQLQLPKNGISEILEYSLGRQNLLSPWNYLISTSTKILIGISTTRKLAFYNFNLKS